MHIVIIGNGIAGITTARNVRKLSDHKITVISSETDHFFSRTALMYIYMGHLRFRDTKPYEEWFWEKNRIELKRAHVEKINFATKELTFSSGENFRYDKLVLALGSASNKFGWPGQDLDGVQGFYSFPDLEKMEQNTKGIKKAVIVGGGLIGIEVAEMLHSRNIPVTFLVRENSFWNNVLPPEESKMINRHIKENHIDLRLETELKEIVPDENGRVKAVISGSGETIECQFVALTAGVHPNIGFVKETELETDRGILVNEFLETNIPDVYAAGDCVQLKNPPAGRRPIEAVWYVGRMQGELRPIVRKAVLRWNLAFEKAGFKNAIVVDQQPDTVTWDAGDIRYNVLRWISSPNPPFGGYGPVFTNPRTGQILGADVMFEYVFFKNRVKREQIYDLGFSEDERYSALQQGCMAAAALQVGNVYGKTLLKAHDLDRAEESELIKQSLFYIVLHEVGHTLGLDHNFAGSNMLSLSEIHDKEIATEKGLYGSVMEYPWTNISPEKTRQGLYATTKPGPYDFWAIEFAYSRAMNDAEAEEKRIEAILAKSHKPELAFGNGADDMNLPGKGIDPRFMLFDMSSDPIGYSVEQLDLIAKTLLTLKEKYTKNGDNFHEFTEAYRVLSATYKYFIRSVSRWIGGIMIDRSVVGQTEDLPHLEPVEKDQQIRAMNVLNKFAFAPGTFQNDHALLPFLQNQRRGSSHYQENDDPKIHQRVLDIQKDLLNHLLHKNVLRRISDTQLYGNDYELSEYLTDLTDAVFKDDLNSVVNSFRQNLQIEYISRLVSLQDDKQSSGYTHLAVSHIFSQVKRIESLMKAYPGKDASTKAHRKYLQHLIKKALDSGAN